MEGTRAGRPPTSVDVARAAGVSQATVSYVLNDNPHARVSEETRQRVRDAAARLGYVPDASARTLRTGRSGIVLIPLSRARVGRLAQELFDAMEDEFRARGYTLVQYGERRLKGVAAAKSWVGLRPAAVLVDADRLTKSAVDLLRTSGTRAIVGFADEPSQLVPAVVMDHRAVGATAARHLVERGRRRLAAIVPREEGIDRMGLARWAGVREVVPEAERIDLAFSEEEAGRVAAGADLPDGIFAYNDEYAMLLISALQDAGIRVPEDVAVVGADDLPLARLMRPRLTTVHFDATATPGELVALMDELVRGVREAVPGAVMNLFRPRLVIRDST
ncbi:LacI family DNA-binding transcriptional regulator [Nonomuraea sp. NN258]|uniref:LacI family DNA-binding transcriptional regulator n=1 Tax=Nonomuraea antri TaxID=2730852 RepID=UPI0015696A96|nr:LacI family DNA-binding transcriptional regulator [Nonomuraea antri]NRQ34949.1 LacI family DNA-binding transcriptional regulator [Nonomuraea antri]